MNLKKQFTVVVQMGEKKDRIRFAISINKLPEYIGKKRADFIIKNLLKSKSQKVRYKVQGLCLIDFYNK